MEFPTVGSHCTFNACNLLDYLPIKCSYCNQNFCKEHFFPLKHSCTPYQDLMDSLVLSTHTITSYPCKFGTCVKSELVPVICELCQLQVCLEHRHKPDHLCPKFSKPAERMVQTTLLVEKILEKNASKKKPGPQGAKSDKLAAKVQLMKLKQNSEGSKELPDDERVYFLVNLSEKKTSKGVFFSKHWSIGKCIDTLATIFKLSNFNNQPFKPQLNLFNSGDECISLRKDAALKDLLGSETLFNGQTIDLRYVETSTQ